MSHRPIRADYPGAVPEFTVPADPLPHVDHHDLDRLTAAGGFVVYDAVDYNALPANAQFLLAYINGAWPNLPQVRARFPHATILTVDVAGTAHADLVDCEGGDASPQTSASRLHTGNARAAYSADSTRAEISQAYGGPFPWWAAEPTGVPHQNPVSIGTQFAWPGHGSPGNYDISLTDGQFFGWVTPTPAPPPAPPIPTPVPAQEASMIDTVPTGGIIIARHDGSVFAEDGAQYWGGMNTHPLAAPIVGIASTLTGHGYWLVGADGGIFNFGDARLLGPSPRLLNLWGLGTGHGPIPVTGIARGAEPGIAYTIISDTGAVGTVPLLYRIPANGSLSA